MRIRSFAAHPHAENRAVFGVPAALILAAAALFGCAADSAQPVPEPPRPDAAADAAPAPDAGPAPGPDAAPAPPDAEPRRPVPSGLQWVGSASVDGTAARLGHSRELAVEGDLIFIADANGLPIFRSNPSGALELVNGVQPERTMHCSSVALHRASSSLLCTATDGAGLVASIDVSDPAAPIVRPWAPAASSVQSVPDIAIDGDVAWLAAQDQGLLRAPIAADGTPGPHERIASASAVVQVAIVGDRVVFLDRVEGLVVLDIATLARLGSAPLAGPPLDLEVDGDHLVVSLGSEGVQVFTLDAAGQPVPGVHVQPRCVATGADLEGDALAVVCLSGVTLYDLAGDAPRVAGYVPSEFGMLDVAFTPFGLLVVDWYVLDVFTAHLDGSVSVPETPRGLRLAPGADAHIPVRNPGDVELEVGWLLEGGARTAESMGRFVLGPREEVTLDLSGAVLEAAGSARNRADVVFASATGDIEPRTRVWHRAATDEPARGKVAIGDPFPIWTRTSPSSAPAVLPIPRRPTVMMFLTVDCYLQWPQLEDMAWSLAHGTRGPVPTVLFLTTWNEDPFDPSQFMRHFGAERLLTVEWADYLGSVPGGDADPAASRVFDMTFSSRLPGADFPHDYFVDARGIVTATSRVYRGRWPLGE